MAITRRSFIEPSFLSSWVLARKLRTPACRLRQPGEPIAGLPRGYREGDPGRAAGAADMSSPIPPPTQVPPHSPTFRGTNRPRHPPYAKDMHSGLRNRIAAVLAAG